MLRCMPDFRSTPKGYGETKKQKQFLLTPTASDYLDAIAKELKATRSDALEQVIRFVHSERASLAARIAEFGASPGEDSEA